MSRSRPLKTRFDELFSVFNVQPVMGDLAGHLRAKQLESVNNLIPATMLAQLINGTVIMIAFGSSGGDRILALWATVLSFMCGLTMLRFMRNQRLQVQTTASRKSIDRVTQAAAIAGTVWGITPIIVIPYAGSAGHMALGIILAAMAFSGAFLMSRIPSAAFAFMIPVLGGLFVGLQLGSLPIYDLLSVLILVYGGLLAACVQWAHARHVEQLINEAALKEQEQLISLLLRDFEESTSDWLWQTDEEGIISGIPAGLQGQKSQYEVMQPGAALVDLFDDCEARDVMLQSVKRRQAFRDLVMPVRGTTGKSWWRLTGKPVFESGFFAGFRGVASDVTASKETEDRIAHLAHYDALTGLPNRVTLLETLERIVRKRPVMGRQRALLWLDLDNFKWVNDTLGHPAGDELLKMVADRLTEACEQEDTIARLGGDEFAVCIERKGGSAHIEAFVRTLSEILAEPYILLGSSARCSASIGVRLLDAFTPDAQTLLQHADLALYKAKSDGRAGWCIFTPDLEAKARRRREVEEDLQRALENNELLVYFQPQIDAKTRKMVGCEALLRWAHPTKGLIYPGHFIETAEDSGLITRLGDWVIRAALEQARRLPEDIRVAVNISPLQIHSANLFPTIVNALATNQLDPSRLDLEITESVLMTDTDFTLDRLHQLKQLGVRISLDDFGTGFSSLSYLRKFPFDKIKIDKSFISDMETSEDSRAITVATLGLAKSLGLRCTAEGVETEFQCKFLQQHGCDELQGYFISRAQPLESLTFFVDVKPEAPAMAQDAVASVSRVILQDDVVEVDEDDSLAGKITRLRSRG